MAGGHDNHLWGHMMKKQRRIAKNLFIKAPSGWIRAHNFPFHCNLQERSGFCWVLFVLHPLQKWPKLKGVIPSRDRSRGECWWQWTRAKKACTPCLGLSNISYSTTPRKTTLLCCTLSRPLGFMPQSMAQGENTESILEKARAICSEKNICFETKVETGDARDVICEQVEKLQADILVIGSHGYGTIKRTFLGSVSDYCVRHAKCPVVIVKLPKD